MIQKNLLFLSKILCCLFFLISVPFTSFFVNTNNQGPALTWLLFTLNLFILLPIFWRFYPPSWNSFKRLGLHAAFSLTLVGLLQFITYMHERSLGPNRYTFHLGNGLGPYSIFTQNNSMQILLKNALSIFPYSTQYIFYTAEDAARVFKLKNDFDNKNFRKEVCKEDDVYECFKSIFLITNKRAAFNSTGCILMMTVGAKIINDEKKKKASESFVKSSIHIMDLSLMIYKSIHSESRVENIIPKFPNKDFHKISNDFKNKIDSTDVLKKVGFKQFFLGFDIPKVDVSIKEEILEAYLLKKIEEGIVKKFDTAILKKMKDVELNV